MKKLIFLVFASLVLVSCGGGSGGSSTPTTDTGQFKDSNTQGLSYASGAQSGITNENGEFTYEIDKSVSFAVGSIALGSAIGKSIITPVDLVEDGNLDTPAVQNITRLLISLDNDGNPDNGINILPEVVGYIEEAELTLDFTTNTFTLDDVISEVNGNQSSRTYTAVTADDAQAHLVDTLRCSYSGAFMGNGPTGNPVYQNEPNDDFGVIVNVHGNIQMIVIDNQSQNNDEYKDIEISNISNALDFTKINLSTSVTLRKVEDNSLRTSVSVTLIDFDNINLSAASYTYTASRFDGDINAKYRFTGLYSPSPATLNGGYGLFTFDIDGSNTITGNAYNLSNDVLYTLGGTIIDNILMVTITQNDIISTVSATIDLEGGTISNGMWSGSSARGTFIGSGCRLN